MQKTGGILGLIGGIFGTFAALATLFIGGVGGALEANDAGLVVDLGLGGLAFSFLSIILGAVAIGTTGRTAGVLLTLCAIGGAILGGSLVAVCMALALVGGILATMGRRKPAVNAA